MAKKYYGINCDLCDFYESHDEPCTKKEFYEILEADGWGYIKQGRRKLFVCDECKLNYDSEN